MEKIILVPRLHEMRFNPREVTSRVVMSHQCNYSHLDVSVYLKHKRSQFGLLGRIGLV